MNELSVILGAVRPDLVRKETLANIFAGTVDLWSEKTALIFHQDELTYRALDKWSNQIADYLVINGVGPGTFVGLWWTRGLELHAAILGIIKAGAAYVPVDREIPSERVELIMEEVGAIACFSNQLLNIKGKILQVPAFDKSVKLEKRQFAAVSANYSDDAYVLYTSGSTGKPKGIPISHQQICHLVRSEQSVLHIEPHDRVYQGFSVSFDMWCEETWISYFAGATLWVADNTTSKAIDELSETLRREQITVLHAVPSLLAIMDDNIPNLRLVNAGGEACTSQVLDKWAKDSLEFFNSYGPTETTVTATIARLIPGDEIVIGQPLPNYNLAVVDEKLNLVPLGQAGELVITGPGVGKGYIDLPELSLQKFVAKPGSLAILPGETVYRTGDSAIINAAGGIELQGRFDDQVKLRGYRIELGEIETRLHELPGVRSAAVAIRKDQTGQEQLVGYVLMADHVSVAEHTFRLELGKTLPSYMVPAVIMGLPEMPRLSSGKISRKALPVPAAFTELTDAFGQETLDPDATTNDKVLNSLHKTFHNNVVEVSMDFFDDLGGHSLLAAGFVSQLRKDAGMPHVSLKDVYLHRPISNLIAFWDTPTQPEPQQPASGFQKTPLWRYLSCWSAQTLALLLIYGLFAFQIFIPYLGYYYVDQETIDNPLHILYAILTSLALFSLIPPIFTLLSLATKWLVIGKFREGDYPLWGTYYFRWWFVKTMQRLLPAQFLNGTPLYPVYLRLLGMKIAADAQISDFSFDAEDLISIGADASLSSQTRLNNAWVEDGLLKLRKIHIGEHAYIGSSAMISGSAVIEDWGELQDLSHLQQGKTIKTAEVWQGSPAQYKETKAIEDLAHPLAVSTSQVF